MKKLLLLAMFSLSACASQPTTASPEPTTAAQIEHGPWEDYGGPIDTRQNCIMAKVWTVDGKLDHYVKRCSGGD